MISSSYIYSALNQQKQAQNSHHQQGSGAKNNNIL